MLINSSDPTKVFASVLSSITLIYLIIRSEMILLLIRFVYTRMKTNEIIVKFPERYLNSFQDLLSYSIT